MLTFLLHGVYQRRTVPLTQSRQMLTKSETIFRLYLGKLTAKLRLWNSLSCETSCENNKRK